MALSQEALALFTGNPLVNIQVSLDGATPEVNDSIRGRGTYFRIIKGIEYLSKINIPLSINTVVTSLNFRQLKQLKELAKTYNANLRVSRFRPSGRARESWDALRLDTAQLKELSAWLESDLSILTGDSFFAISQDKRRKMGLDMCGACKMTCCIDPSGNVFPCAFLQDLPFCGGNLREKTTRHSRPDQKYRISSPLGGEVRVRGMKKSIPHSGKSANPGGRFKDIWDNAPSFLRLRKLEPSACRACPRFEKCRGGCPAVAYFVTRDLNTSDPECITNWSRDVSDLSS
jgi:radical SAM protein with 4Fe4S-binding SPASM domain